MPQKRSFTATWDRIRHLSTVDERQFAPNFTMESAKKPRASHQSCNGATVLPHNRVLDLAEQPRRTTVQSGARQRAPATREHLGNPWKGGTTQSTKRPAASHQHVAMGHAAPSLSFERLENNPCPRSQAFLSPARVPGLCSMSTLGSLG